MQDLPHRYAVAASAQPEGEIALSAPGLPVLGSAAPAEFGGPGDRWSPETLLAGAVADCFALTFRAIARASKLEWSQLECAVEATLDRVDKKTRFTAFAIRARLRIPTASEAEKARRLLEKAESSCLVTNSLAADIAFEAQVETA